MIRWIALLTLVALAPDADAGCPGGGGGGGGGGPGGGGAGDALRLDAELTPPRRGDPPCVDDSDIVGYRHCRRFGAWGVNLDVPPIIIEGGAIVRRFGSLLDGQTGLVNHGAAGTFAYRATAVTGRRALDTAVLSTVRVTFVLPHHLYTAVEVDAGGLTRPGGATTEMMTTGAAGTPALSQGGGLVVDGLAAVGARATFGLGALGAELAGGLRMVSYGFDSQYLSCATTTSVLARAAVAEARVRGELWLGPWIAAGVTVGTSVLEQRAWMGGVYLGIHTRAFNGER